MLQEFVIDWRTYITNFGDIEHKLPLYIPGPTKQAQYEKWAQSTHKADEDALHQAQVKCACEIINSNNQTLT